MALLYIATFYKAPVTYTLRFDTDTQSVVLTTTGGEPDPVLGDEYLPAPPGTAITYFCTGTTEYSIISQVFIPFAQVVTIANSTNCGYVPPPPPPDPAPDVQTYTRIYRGTYSNIEEGRKEIDTSLIEAVTILICDGESLVDGEAETEYIDMEMGGDPLHLATDDNNESKYTPVRATKATIQILSGSGINADTFVEGADDRWKTIIQIGGADVFSGYLLTDEINEDFNSDPNIVQLVAVDHLGLLKDVPLVKPDGTAPKYTPDSHGNYKLIEYISWALQLTGLHLDIFVIDNLFEESFPNLPAFDHTYLNYKTFEGDQIGTCIDARTVLERILGEEYFLKQWQNAWWIARVDEYENRNFSAFHFNYKGEYIDHLTDVDLTLQVGENPNGEKLFEFEHIENQSVKFYNRAFKEVHENFNFNLPKEIVDNQDFSRGQWLSPVPVPNKTVDGKSYYGQAFNFEDWTAYQGAFGSTTPANGSAYIIRYFFEDVERERFLQLTSVTNAEQWVKSNGVPFGTLDKLTFSVDVRMSGKSVILGPLNVMVRLILVGDDGITYLLVGDAKEAILGPGPGLRWLDINNLPADAIPAVVFQGEATDQWQTISTDDEVPGVPVSGDLYINLPFAASDVLDYDNLKLEYIPYINGGYGEYKGQQHQITNLVQGLRAVRDEECFITDSPKKLFKGCLLKKDTNGKFVLTERWYNGAVFPGGLPADEFLHTRGRTQAFSIWNQHNRTFRILDSRLDGLTTTGDIVNNGLPDCLHKWVHADVTPHTYNRFFLLLHYDMDFYLCAWSGYFAEVYHKDIVKDYASPYQFKYLRQ